MKPGSSGLWHFKACDLFVVTLKTPSTFWPIICPWYLIKHPSTFWIRPFGCQPIRDRPSGSLNQSQTTYPTINNSPSATARHSATSCMPSNISPTLQRRLNRCHFPFFMAIHSISNWKWHLNCWVTVHTQKCIRILYLSNQIYQLLL